MSAQVLAEPPTSLRFLASTDRWILYGGRATRGFGAGALSVALPLDLRASYPVLLIGLFLGGATVAAAAWALAAERFEQRSGRRLALAGSAACLASGGFLLFLGVGSIYLVLGALLLGGILAGPGEIGPLPALEQASIASIVTDGTRTRTFGEYNLLGYLGTAAGALLASPLTSAGGVLVPAHHDLVLLLYAFIGAGLVPAYLRLSGRADELPQRGGRKPLSASSRPTVLTLSGLFSVDAFGGGLVANFLITLWLHERFSASGAQIGAILAAGTAAAAVSLALATPLARRFGLVSTMVFTHLPSSVLLIAFAFAPDLGSAAGLWVARSLLSQMDVPTRQSFVQAVVAPAERTAAAGYTTAARSSAALGGPVTGALLNLGGPWISAPFLIAGSAKIAYDAALYRAFRRVRAPEELHAQIVG